MGLLQKLYDLSFLGQIDSAEQAQKAATAEKTRENTPAANIYGLPSASQVQSDQSAASDQDFQAQVAANKAKWKAAQQQALGNMMNPDTQDQATMPSPESVPVPTQAAPSSFPDPRAEFQAKTGIDPNLTMKENVMASLAGKNTATANVMGRGVYMSQNGDVSATPQPGFFWVPSKTGGESAAKENVARTNIQARSVAPDDVARVGEMVINGQMAFDQVPGGMGPTSMRTRVASYIAQNHPEFNAQQNSANFAGMKGYAHTMNAAGVQQPIKLIQSVIPNMDELVKLSDQIPRTQFPPVNSVEMKALIASGDPQVAAYATASVEVADQVAKILQGGGTGNGTSDAKLKQAGDMFNQSFTPDQLKSVIGSLKPLLANRIAALQSNTYQVVGGQPQATPPQAPATPPPPSSQQIVDAALNSQKISQKAKALIKNKRAQGVSDDEIARLLQ